jgi:hypothetical protein
MSEEPENEADPEKREPPKDGLGILFVAAALGIALILGVVAVAAYLAFRP